jgi:transglutaminase-like putative cysteine protease
MKHKQDALRSKNWITQRGVIKKTVAFGPQMVSTFLTTAEVAEVIRDEMLLGSLLSRRVPYKGSSARSINNQKAVYIVEKLVPDDADVMEANFDLYRLWDQKVRQRVQSNSPFSARLTVDRELEEAGGQEPNADQVAQYLARSKYLQKEHPTIKKLVEKLEAAAGQSPLEGAQPDARATALSLAAALQKDFRIDPLDAEFASAVDAARLLRGDAIAHAILLATTLRHQDLPTRIALGFKPDGTGQLLVFHPWVEVWLGEKWLSIDPATAREITLDCLKCTDSAFSDSNPYTVLLPIFRAMPYLSVQLESGT